MSMKKFPFKVVLLGVVSAILLTITVALIWRLALNHSFVSDYNKQVYAEEKENKLLTVNSPEAYLPYYNLGNVAYKNGDYNAAISYYNQALANNPPKERECQIRINLALAMCNTIDFYHMDTKEKVDTALIVLYKARDTLTEKGCASPEGHDGHNEDAQQLKEDIDKLIEKLKNLEFMSPPPQGGDDNDQNQDGGGGGGSQGNDGSDENKIKNKINKNRDKSNGSRSDEQNELGGFGGLEPDDGGGSGEDGVGGYNNPW